MGSLISLCPFVMHWKGLSEVNSPPPSPKIYSGISYEVMVSPQVPQSAVYCLKNSTVKDSVLIAHNKASLLCITLLIADLFEILQNRIFVLTGLKEDSLKAE